MDEPGIKMKENGENEENRKNAENKENKENEKQIEEEKTKNYIELIKSCNNVNMKRNEEIETLELCMEKVIDLKVFQNFQNLKELYLIKSGITDITPLFQCTNLIVLFLQINKISSIIGIEKLKNLEKLNMFNNDLNENFVEIEKNKNLKYIDLSDNKIECVDLFENTNNYVYINLANNKIKNIDGLKNNINLEYLDISGNKIETFEDIKVVQNMKKLKTLFLSSIYYGSNPLTKGILYKHYFYINLPSLKVLDHENINGIHRIKTIHDVNIIKNLIDFKIHYIYERYQKEKFYIMFINNKNISYINCVMKPLNFMCNFEYYLDQLDHCDKKMKAILEIKNQVDFVVSAYTDRFNYIMRKLDEQRDLEIKYMKTSLNSYLNIFFKDLDKEEDEFKQIEYFIKTNFHASNMKNYFIDDIKIENIKKVKKLNHDKLDIAIENHLNRITFEKQQLFLHPYHYTKINEHFEFSKNKDIDHKEAQAFSDPQYVCSSFNLGHILKTLIKIFVETDNVNNLIHPIYQKIKNKGNVINKENSINVKKKIVKTKRFDFPSFPIYIVETYFFPGQHKTVYAYNINDEKNVNEYKSDDQSLDIDKHKNGTKKDQGYKINNTNQNKETQLKLNFTRPEHTNLKYIINVNLRYKATKETKEDKEDKEDRDKDKKDKEKVKENSTAIVENEIEKNEINEKKNKHDTNETTLTKSMESVISNLNENETPINFFTYKKETDINADFAITKRVEENLCHFLYHFQYINFYHVTKYFIELSKIICIIKKIISILFLKKGIHLENFHQALPQKWNINEEQDIQQIYKHTEKLKPIFKSVYDTANIECDDSVESDQKDNNNINQLEQSESESENESKNENESENESRNESENENEKEKESENDNKNENASSIEESKKIESSNKNDYSIKTEYVKKVEDVTALYINSLHICKLKISALHNYRNLKKLHLRNNSINDLHFFCFDTPDLENLEVLDLACNSIVDLMPIYKKFPNLKYLDISFNYINEYSQILKYSKYHKHVEYLNVLNNSFYVEPDHYSTIHFFYPQIKKFNNLLISNNRDIFDINMYAFLSPDLERSFDEYQLYSDIISDEYKKPISAKEILENDHILHIHENIDVHNYHMFIRIINLSNLQSPIYSFDFSKFENLQILNLSNNAIENANTLLLPKNLKVLDLQNNKITSLEFITDTSLQIEKIILDNNKLTEIEQITNLKKLKILRVSHNKIQRIPIFQDLSLTEINIHSNLIKDITPLVLIKNKKALITMNIYNNKVSFPDLDLYLIHVFPKLIFLNNCVVHRNPKLEKMFKHFFTPDVFFNMYHLYPPYNTLVSLDLHNLKIKKICFNIDNDNFKNLSMLDLSNNNITDIKDIGPLDSLKVLNLSNNKHITENSFQREGSNTLNSFKSLEELNVSNCMITKTTFLKTCASLKNMKTLNLEGNKITTINGIEKFKKLKNLNLSNNKISKIKPGCFPENLETLNLSNNLIRNLSPLSNLKTIETLDIRVNRIENVEEFKHLQNLHNLKTLHINGNRKIKEHFLLVKGILQHIENFDIKLTDTPTQSHSQETQTQKKEETKLSVSHIKPYLSPTNSANMSVNIKNNPKAKLIKSTVQKQNVAKRLPPKEELTVIARKIERSEK